ncbi:hypothetical protein ACLFMI_20470 [Pseudonocardia nantongensis]|uniref:hypothetical protein n=1 Tax=Pseudonocardia nantongensis TaxID=1181885 RepID=UPI0039780912
MPAMLAGVAATAGGLRPTTPVYGGVVVALAAVPSVLARKVVRPATGEAVCATSSTA